MKRETYYHGAGMKWGIYNTVAKEFQFGICEDSPMLAEARLFFKIGDSARKYRFEARSLPKKKPEPKEKPCYAKRYEYERDTYKGLVSEEEFKDWYDEHCVGCEHNSEIWMFGEET